MHVPPLFTSGPSKVTSLITGSCYVAVLSYSNRTIASRNEALDPPGNIPGLDAQYQFLHSNVVNDSAHYEDICLRADLPPILSSAMV